MYTADIFRGLTRRNRGQRAGEQIERDRRVDDIGGNQPVMKIRGLGDLVEQQAERVKAALAHAGEDDGAGIAGFDQELGKGPFDILIGEEAGLNTVFAIIHEGIERGLAIARRKQRAGTGERRGVIGQRDFDHGPVGAFLAQVRIPVRPSRIGRWVDKKDGRFIRVSEFVGGVPSIRLRVINAVGWRISLERFARILEGLVNLVSQEPAGQSGDDQQSGNPGDDHPARDRDRICEHLTFQPLFAHTPASCPARRLATHLPYPMLTSLPGVVLTPVGRQLNGNIMFRWLRNSFLTGIVIATPLGVTLYLIVTFVGFVDNVVKP